MHAMKEGKHVCVQKPLTNTLWEAQQLLLAARKKNVVTNMGNQGHTGEGLRLLKEWIQQDAIGKVKSSPQMQARIRSDVVEAATALLSGGIRHADLQ